MDQQIEVTFNPVMVARVNTNEGRRMPFLTVIDKDTSDDDGTFSRADESRKSYISKFAMFRRQSTCG